MRSSQDPMAYTEVPDVPDSEVTDWKHVTDALKAKLLEVAEGHLVSSKAYLLDTGHDQGSMISGDTNFDLRDMFWEEEALPLYGALLKLDPCNAVLRKLAACDTPYDVRGAFSTDPVLACLCERMGHEWMESTFPLSYGDHETLSGVVAFFDAFEARLKETLRFISFPRSADHVMAALGLGRRFRLVNTEIEGGDLKQALAPLEAHDHDRLQSDYDRLRSRVRGEQ
jgi:hypothetical protein